MEKKIKHFLAFAISTWLLVQAGDVSLDIFRKNKETVWEERYSAMESRLKECSVYAPQCNPAVFYTVPKPRTESEIIRDAIAKEQDDCRAKVNKAYGSVMWNAKQIVANGIKNCEATCTDLRCFHDCGLALVPPEDGGK